MDKTKQKKLIKFIDENTDNQEPQSLLIAILHKAQEIFGYLDRETMDLIADKMNIPTSHIWGVATFYHYFKLKPQGKHVISICLGTACYVKGAQVILDTIKDVLKIDLGATTEDGLFTLQEARCLGACGLAPIISIDNKVYGELTPQETIKIIEKYRKQSG